MPAPRLRSVNISGLVAARQGDRDIQTGIFKKPVDTPVPVRTLGLEGDRQGDLKHHGGPHKAAYAYTAENIAHWRTELARPDLAPGSMGENLTTEGLDEADVCIGDRFAIGSCILEVSEPRLPCATLAMAMDDKTFPKRFLASGRVGFYLRVIHEGELRVGDDLRPVPRAETGPRIPVAQVARLLKLDTDNIDGARRCLELTTLGPTWRERFQARVQ